MIELTALIVSIVSFVTVIITGLTLGIQRKHNRIQLLPIVHIYCDVNRGDEFITYKINVINDGSGVAIMKKIELITIDNEVIDIKNSNELFNFIEQKNPDSKDITTSVPRCISNMSSIILYGYKIPKKSKDRIYNCKITIITESYYGDQVITNKQDYKIKYKHFYNKWF
jgi:hypothetical protein